MSRPKKQTVDYFPHNCNHGKSMFIIEQKYGNDGYAFWFKLLELLGSAEGHILKLIEDIDWEFLIAKTKLDKEKCNEILNLLASIGSIDKELWNEKIVWSDNFIENIKDAYRNRTAEIPVKPDILRKKPVSNGINDVSNPQSKVKESKGKESKEPPTPFEEIKNLYLTNCLLLPVIEELTEQRKTLIKARWQKRNDLSIFENLFKKANESKFLTGNNKKNWKASFDWLLNVNNIVKVLEGNYDNKKSGSSGGRKYESY